MTVVTACADYFGQTLGTSSGIVQCLEGQRLYKELDDQSGHDVRRGRDAAQQAFRIRGAALCFRFQNEILLTDIGRVAKRYHELDVLT